MQGLNGLGARGHGRAWSGASTGNFRGVSLSDVLARAGVKDSAVEIVFEGADAGLVAGAAVSQPFARSLPRDAAVADDALLVLGMNGEALPLRHGGPLRVVFPGRYATDSVKWLRRIVAARAPFDGFYQQQRYRRANRDGSVSVPVAALNVQSEIARPRTGDRLPRGMRVDIIGVAWGGQGGLDRVEVSVDGGKSFARADFLDPPRPHCGQRWLFRWTPDEAGTRLLVARATDRSGTAQPLSSAEERGELVSISGPDRIQYANNAVPTIAVTVT